MNVSSPSPTLLDALVEALSAAGTYNRNDQVAPAAVLWPDKERQWEVLLPVLRARLPLLTFDHARYAPAERTGPAYYLRCMVARALPDDRLPDAAVPIIYLPGVGKAELRAVEECPRALQPLAELQYRGVLWTHRNGRDWTIAGFLQAADGGLGIDVGADNATREALLRALPHLVGETVASLRREASLRAPYFDALLNPDEARALLLWLNDPTGYPARCTQAEWEAFRGLCARKYGFSPQGDGEVTAAALLGERQGGWEVVWRRFAEAPASYGALPRLLERAQPRGQGTGTLFYHPDSWPLENEQAEAHLRAALAALRDALPAKARAALATLEDEHGPRRSWVWGALGHAPLATALAHLTALAGLTERAVTAPSVAEIADAYAAWGWQADAAALDALAAVESPPDVTAVAAALIALYRPWLEAGATALQAAMASAGPAGGYIVGELAPPEPGACVLFSDALRLDIARRLAADLEHQGLACTVDYHLAALPPVTPTAKPAISPVTTAFSGQGATGLAPLLAGKARAVTVEVLRGALGEAGYQVLRGDETGDPAGRAWTELGAIDSYGHEHGWKLAHHVAGELRALRRRIEALLEAGWRRVVVVTDHGWLLLPGGLPRAELPEHLTVTRKGRCARLKEGAVTDEQVVPWHWAPGVRIAVAPGICCYEAGREYEHGGLSPQECVVPLLTVTSPASRSPLAAVSIEGLRWVGLRCRVTLAAPGPLDGLLVDLRSRPADPTSSLAAEPKPAMLAGPISLAVADDEQQGHAAVVVVLDAAGRVLAQQPTIVGG